MLTLRGLTLTAAAPRIIVPLFARSLDALRPLTAAAQADPAAELVELRLDPLPAAKHIFSHIEWHMSGILLHLPAQSAPAGCVWASRAELRTTYTLPGAFAAYKDRMLG